MKTVIISDTGNITWWNVFQQEKGYVMFYLSDKHLRIYNSFHFHWSRHHLLCNHSNGDLSTCEENLLFSGAKMLVFAWKLIWFWFWDNDQLSIGKRFISIKTVLSHVYVTSCHLQLCGKYLLPGGPGNPLSPFWPGSPRNPGLPSIPRGPWIETPRLPLFPCGPGSPMGPGGPGGPFIPASPMNQLHYVITNATLKIDLP